MKVAVLTPERADPAWRLPWQAAVDDLGNALRARGLTVVARSWTDAPDLASFALVLPLLAWGYHRRIDAWRRSLAAWDRLDVKLRNTSALLAWNSSKRYLRDLDERRVPVVPTHYVATLSEQSLLRASTTLGSERLVIKPEISASAWRTVLWSRGEGLRGAPRRNVLIQPYVESIETEGELSIIAFGGQVSHAVRKLPARGDFRVQQEHGGRTVPHDPVQAELDLAMRTIAALPSTPLYARLDMVWRDGGPEIMEVELIEPYLFLDRGKEHRRNFATAVESALTG